MRAKYLYTAIAILNEGLRLDSARIDGLVKVKADLKTALALCENTVSNKTEAIEAYKMIAKNNKKKARNRIFYFGAGGLAVGLLTGLIIAR